MKSWFATSLVLVVMTSFANAASLLERPIHITPELEPFIVEAADGRLFLEIDDMLIPIDTGEKSAIYGTTWAGGVVYYQFGATVDDADGRPMSGDGAGRRAAWRAAAMEWQATVPGLTFVESTGAGNYIEVVSAGGNSSNVGMITGTQTMNIYNWNYRFIIAHEISHALGLMHEQTRPDRDTYVTVNYANIQADKTFNYDVWPGTTSHGTYDYTSVMHYSRCTFAVNCGEGSTMDATVAGAAMAGLTQAEANDAMGNRNDLSTTDIEGIRYLYPGSVDLIFASCLENGRSNAWSSVSGEAVSCAHDICDLGVPLDAVCDPCVTQICAFDSYCCSTSWDSICVGYVVSVCGGSCS